MTFSMQSHHELRFAVEESYGQLPDPASFAQMRHTGCDLSLSRSSIESDEIRSDRKIGEFFHGTEKVSGEIDFELSFGAQDDFLAAVLMSNWSGDTLVTGSAVQSFALERAFMDVSEYQLYSGCCVDRMDLSLQPESLFGGRFHINGQSLSLGSDPADASPAASTAHAPMEAFKGAVSEGGALLGYVTGLELKIENGLAGSYALGSRAATAAHYAKSRISGELTAYFEDQSLHQKFLDQSHSSLSVSIAGAGGAYEVTLPRILYMSADNPVRAERAVSSHFRFVALNDPITSTDISITRTAE